MKGKISLLFLTLALAGSLCACGQGTGEVNPTPTAPQVAPDPTMTPENRSGIVGRGYDGTWDDGTWDDGMWGMDDAARDAADDMGRLGRDVGDMARGAVNDVIAVSMILPEAWSGKPEPTHGKGNRERPIFRPLSSIRIPKGSVFSPKYCEG